jgi:hypothetical protein
MNKPNFAGIVYPQSRSCLLAISVLYFSLQGLMLQLRFASPAFYFVLGHAFLSLAVDHPRSPGIALPTNKFSRFASLSAAALIAIVSLLLLLVNAIGQRADGALWSLALCTGDFMHPHEYLRATFMHLSHFKL